MRSTRPGRDISAAGSLSQALILQINPRAAAVAAALGFTVMKVSVQSHRSPPVVIIQISRNDGANVSIADCEQFSRRLDLLLDEEGDGWDHAFVLEVSSPGIGEELRHDQDFRSFRGFPVELRCWRGDDQEIVRGALIGRDERVIKLNRKGRITSIPRNEVVQVRFAQSTELT